MALPEQTDSRSSRQVTQPLSSLYQDILLDHYRRPRNSGVIERPDAHSEARNPLCGDRVELTLTFDSDGRVNDARFTGEGCSIAKASASMLTEAVRGQTREEMRAMREQVLLLLSGEGGADAEESAEALGDVRALAGVARYPARVKCARMAWDALMQAVM